MCKHVYHIAKGIRICCFVKNLEEAASLTHKAQFDGNVGIDGSDREKIKRHVRQHMSTSHCEII